MLTRSQFAFSVNDTTGSPSMALRMLNISATNHSTDMNHTSVSEMPHFPFDNPLTKGAETTAYVVLLLLTLVGNVLVIHIIRRNPTLGSTVDLLIVNMCISDLLIPLFAIPYRIRETYVGAKWIGGDLQSQTITLDSGFLFPHTPCPMLFCRFKKISKEKSTSL